MPRRTFSTALLRLALLMFSSSPAPLFAQALGQPDADAPGDALIQRYLAQETRRLESQIADDNASLEQWQQNRERYQREYFYMLGLWPLPERTPLLATGTGTFEGDGYIVEKLHYQSRPRLYVTANLYRPARTEPGQRLPAVLYVCGHSGMGRNGNKTAFQSHGVWFARHGYVCLVVDTLQLGEIAALHHGTYREQRWWWHSRGYTSAGVECWNGVRGIDYLISRPDVDAERIAVTGISGGSAATFWVAAADERVKVAVPVSGMADLESYVTNRVINGHCDCMFLYNTFQWPWTRIANLVAPRPMLFINSDQDPIFPMDANDRVINRLERMYSLYAAGDRVDSVVSIGGHAYRRDIRESAYRFINTYLKDDSSPITDSEVDLADGERNDRTYTIPPEALRVFANDEDLPKDEWNTTIDERFVPQAEVALPKSAPAVDAWRAALVSELRRVSFRPWLHTAETAVSVDARAMEQESPTIVRLETEPGIVIRLEQLAAADDATSTQRILLWVRTQEETARPPAWVGALLKPGDVLYECRPRGVGESRWTRRNPPNYVERSHALLGQTVDACRVRDVLAAAAHLSRQHKLPVQVMGEGDAAIIAAYAALFAPLIKSPESETAPPCIAGLVLHDPPASHMSAAAPAILNVLRVCDIPDVLGMLAPLPLTVTAADQEDWQRARSIYELLGAGDQLTLLPLNP
jgi:dienelactone hydrolase